MIAAWLLSATWKGSLLILLVLATLRLLRGRMPARWAHALLLVALARLVLPVAPESPFSIFNLAPQGDAAVMAATVPPDAPAPAIELQRAPLLPVQQAGDSNVAESVLLAIWAAGAAFALARAATQAIAFRRRLRDAIPIDRISNPIVAQLVDGCANVLGVRQDVAIAITSAVSAPALHGWRKPSLLLPPDFLQTLTLEQLRFVTLHELAHLRRSDVLVNWATTVVHALHWFNPLVRIATTRLAEERELACDALALECLAADARAAYGGTLLQLVDRLRQPALAPGLVGMTNTTKHQMKRRILMIANFRSQSRRSPACAALVAAIALVTLTDANAAEPIERQVLPLSPAIEAVMARLEVALTLELTSTSIETILNTVSNHTGMRFDVAEGAIDDAIRAARITIKATDAPAHAIVIETLASLDLAVRFTEEGATIEKIPHGVRVMRVDVPPPAPNAEIRVLHSEARSRGGEEDVIVSAPRTVEVNQDNVMLRSELEETRSAGEGVTRTRLKFRGGKEGQPEGSLELEVRRADSSTTR